MSLGIVESAVAQRLTMGRAIWMPGIQLPRSSATIDAHELSSAPPPSSCSRSRRGGSTMIR